MLDSLLQFGLGAALIGLFFVPFVNKLYQEIGRLNQVIKEQADQRYSDVKEIVVPVIDHLREAKETDKLILAELLKRNG
jgi:hypothetical protein